MTDAKEAAERIVREALDTCDPTTPLVHVQRAALVALLSAQGGGGWRTIESAPKNGAPIIGFGDYEKEIDRWKRPEIVQWSVGDNCWIYWRGYYDAREARKPWMPPTIWHAFVWPTIPTSPPYANPPGASGHDLPSEDEIVWRSTGPNGALEPVKLSSLYRSKA